MTKFPKFFVTTSDKVYAFQYSIPTLPAELDYPVIITRIDTVIVELSVKDIDSLHNHLQDSRLHLSDNAAKALVKIQDAGIECCKVIAPNLQKDSVSKSMAEYFMSKSDSKVIFEAA